MVTAQQHGPRIQNYRDNSDPFIPSKINIVIVSESGEYVGSGMTEGRSFMATCIVEDGVLKAGKYFFMIDPYFNSSADSSTYRNLTVGVYAGGHVNF